MEEIRNREKVIGKLIKGRELTTQLQILLQKPYGSAHGSVSTDDLMTEILRSFTETLSVLSSWKSCPIPSTAQVGSPNCGDRGSEYSGGCTKRMAARKDRRGCYQRRRTTKSWTVVSPSTEDDYAWRKYGQKAIHNAKYPRCYFRCTHKHNQGCKATKQVQRMEEEEEDDDSTMYRTTYFGQHTCIDYLKAPQTLIHNPDPEDLCLLSFETKINPNGKLRDHPVKKEAKEEALTELSDNISSLDSIVWPDLMGLESPESPKRGFEHADVISTSFDSLDHMDFLGNGSDDFKNDFYFDDKFV